MTAILRTIMCGAIVAGIAGVTYSQDSAWSIEGANTSDLPIYEDNVINRLRMIAAGIAHPSTVDYRTFAYVANGDGIESNNIDDITEAILSGEAAIGAFAGNHEGSEGPFSSRRFEFVVRESVDDWRAALSSLIDAEDDRWSVLFFNQPSDSDSWRAALERIIVGRHDYPPWLDD